MSYILYITANIIGGYPINDNLLRLVHVSGIPSQNLEARIGVIHLTGRTRKLLMILERCVKAAKGIVAKIARYDVSYPSSFCRNLNTLPPFPSVLGWPLANHFLWIHPSLRNKHQWQRSPNFQWKCKIARLFWNHVARLPANSIGSSYKTLDEAGELMMKCGVIEAHGC